MSAVVNDIRDAVSVVISGLTLPMAFSVTTKAGKKLNAENTATAVVTVGGAAQQIERLGRGDGQHRPILAVGVHRKLGVNTDGEVDQTQFDQCIEFCETLSKSLLSPHASYTGFTPLTSEIPQIYSTDALEKEGMFRSVILVTYHAEFEG